MYKAKGTMSGLNLCNDSYYDKNEPPPEGLVSWVWLVWYVNLLKLVKSISYIVIVDDKELLRFMKFHKFNRGIDCTHYKKG